MSLPEVVWEPNEGPQTDFLASTAFEAMTGGARGGGKSEGLVMDPLTQVDISDFRAIFFRLTYPDLQQLIERTHKYYKRINPYAHWNGTEKEWRFPSGAKVAFRFLKNDDDWLHYQGHEYHWMGFEELTQFTEKQYISLMASCRTSNPNIKCSVRSTTNPGNRGHNWVKNRFVDPFPNGRRIIRDKVTGLTRIFYPSTFRNNPQLLKADPNYVKRLMMLPEADRKAMMDGDWDAFTGSVFRLRKDVHRWSWDQFNKTHNLPRDNRKIPKEWVRYRVLDWGYSSPFACYWVAVDFNNRAWVYREWYGVDYDRHGAIKANVGIKMVPPVFAKRVVAIEEAAEEENVIGIADGQIFDRMTELGNGPSRAEQMEEQGLYHSPASKARLDGKSMFHNYLHYEHTDQFEVIDYPMMVFLEEETPHAIRTIPTLEYDPHNVEDVNTLMEDHAYDAIRYFCMARPYAPQITETPTTIWDPRRQYGNWQVT